MINVQTIVEQNSARGRDLLLPARIEAGFLSAATSVALVINTAFFEAFTSSRLLIVLVFLLALHVAGCSRLLFSREFAMYAAFVGYMFIQLFWTPDVLLALNTLFPAVNFVLITVLLGSLVAFRNTRAVITGALVGFWIGAASYTYLEGFPLVIPDSLSYNAVAGMYLYGLFLTTIYAWNTRRRFLPLLSALLLMVHIIATTSLKTNFGILLGLAGASIVYSKVVLLFFRRVLIVFAVGCGVIVYAILSNETVLDRFQYAMARASIGLQVLQTRENVAGYSGFDERSFWLKEGLQAWFTNPLFGHGVEAFRFRYGITSHSTPVDLLYNNGLIGILLFFGMFASLTFRLIAERDRTLACIVLAGVICQVFISLSGTLFYQTFVAAFVAISAALLKLSTNEESILRSKERL